MLFDEPLTVIDPHLKWQLRRKLKQIHHELKLTLIYVTHDQVEALTFADQVVVMTRGRAVQIGSAVGAVRAAAAHLRRPLHRLAGHELPAGAARRRRARRRRARALAAPRAAAPAGRAHARHPPRVRDARRAAARRARCRPTVTQAQDIGTYWLLTAQRRRRRALIRARLAPGRRRSRRPATPVWLQRARRAHLLLQGRAS